MATGRGNQLTKQVGEYLVAAELARRGYLSATFSGNVPDYDIIATNAKFRAVPVQVKAIASKSWQLDFARFAEVRFDGKRQVVGEPHRLPRKVACVFVVVGIYGEDRFCILEWHDLRDLLIKKYKANLQSKDGIRPKRYDSLHSAITEAHLEGYKDNWDLLAKLCNEA